MTRTHQSRLSNSVKSHQFNVWLRVEGNPNQQAYLHRFGMWARLFPLSQANTIVLISCLTNLDPGKTAYGHFRSLSQKHKIDSKQFNQCLLRPREVAKKQKTHRVHFAKIIVKFQSSVSTWIPDDVFLWVLSLAQFFWLHKMEAFFKASSFDVRPMILLKFSNVK